MSSKPNRIRHWRHSQHMTQAELARRVGLHNSTVCLHESGLRGLSKEVEEAYCKALGVDCIYSA